MKCAGCSATANADAARYGKLWCTACVISIEFEERLARQNGMVVGDVFVDAAGHLAVLLDGEGGRELSRGDFERVALTEADVLRELIDAMAAFRGSVLVADGRIRLASRDAYRCAKRFLQVALKYRTLLGHTEQESTDQMIQIARVIVEGRVANANVN